MRLGHVLTHLLKGTWQNREMNTNLIIHSCWLSILIIPFLLKELQQIIYANLRHKHLSTQNKLSLLTLINFVIVIEFVISLYWVHLRVAPESDPDYYYKVFDSTHYISEYWSLQHTVGAILAFQFAKVFNILAATRSFGPMIHILSSMIVKVFKFAVIELGILLIFFWFGRLCFFLCFQNMIAISMHFQH